MTNEKNNSKLAWDLLVELRKEIVGAQQVRTKVIGFKITFVSSAIGVIMLNSEKVDLIILVVPAFAAIFFDLLINSYSISIKRIGYYCKKYLEPKLRKSCGWPKNEPLWEEYMSNPVCRQGYSLIGNLGITTLTIVPAIIAIVQPFHTIVSLPLLFCLLVLFAYDVMSFLKPRKISEFDSHLKKKTMAIQKGKTLE